MNAQTRRNLYALRYGVQVALSRDMFDVDVDLFDTVEPHLSDQVRMLVTGSIWGEEVGRRQWRFPATRWDAVKHYLLPPWIRRWVPIRYLTEEIVVHALYPDFRPAVLDGRHVYAVDVIRFDDFNAIQDHLCRRQTD